MRQSQPIVFVGPSLDLMSAQGIVDAEFRPPLRRGDLDAIPDLATAGIIDGVLDAELRLQPDELNRAAHRQIQLVGASSTGALLAATNREYILGIGRVYGLLMRHPDSADDLISVLCFDHYSEPLTVPLANAVLTLEDAICVAERRSYSAYALIAALGQIPISKRDTNSILAGVNAHLSSIGIKRRLDRIIDYKAKDAKLLLCYLRHTIIAS